MFIVVVGGINVEQLFRGIEYFNNTFNVFSNFEKNFFI